MTTADRSVQSPKVARLVVVFLGAFCFAPFLYLVWFALEFSVETLRSDQFGLVSLIEKHLNGELSLADLWVQQNAHRLFFPKLIMLPLAKATHWNHRFEILVILTCAFVTYLTVMWRLVSVYKAGANHRGILWLNAAILSTLFFSLSQYKNWMWGMQIQLMLSVAAAIAGLCILSHRVTIGRVIAALVLGFVSTHSFAIGVVYWVVALLPLLLAPVANPKIRVRLISAWALSSALAVFSFFYGFRTQGLGFHALIDAPLHHLLYILAYLGSPLVHDSLQGAIVAGSLGLGLLGWLAWLHIQHYATAVHTLLPLLSIALFAVGSAAMTAVGRNHLPLEQALQSRYITISQLLWVANITMVCLTLSAQQKLRPGRSLGKAASIGFLLLVQLCIASNHLAGMDNARAESRIFNRAARAIVASYPNVDVRNVKRLTPRIKQAIKVLPIVYENKLSLFRAPSSSD